MIARTWRCESCSLPVEDGITAHVVNHHGFPQGETLRGARRMVLHLDQAGGEYTSVYEWTLTREGATVNLTETLHQPPRPRASTARPRARRHRG